MAEFAIVVPLLTLMLLGLVELGRFTYYSIAVGNAANAGAQYGSQSTTTAAQTAAIQTAATTDGQNNIHNITAVATTVCSCWNDSAGTESPAPPVAAQCGLDCTTGTRVTYVQVRTSGNYSALFNYGLLPASFSVSATATMRVRQ